MGIFGDKQPEPIDFETIGADELQRAISSGQDDPPVESPAPKGLSQRDTTAPKPAPVTGEVVDVNRRLAGLARTVKSQTKKATGAILAAGEALAEAQDLLANHAGGSFGKWVTDKCSMSRRQAYRLIGLWDTWGGCDTVAQLADIDALRKMAGAPDGTVKKAIELMEDGQHLDLAPAKTLMASTATKKAKKNRPAPLVIQTKLGSVSIVARDGADPRRVLLDALDSLRKREAA